MTGASGGPQVSGDPSRQIPREATPVVLEILARTWEHGGYTADLVAWLDEMMHRRYGLNTTHPAERDNRTEDMDEWDYAKLLSFLQEEVK